MVSIFFGVFLAPAPGVAVEETEVLQTTMRRIYTALSSLLPASLDEEKFRDPTQRSKVLAKLRDLARFSAELEMHADERDPTFRYLNRSFGRDVVDIQQSYLTERFEEARFFVIEMTQNCIACHSRLPSDGGFDPAKELTASIEVAALGRRERVNLLFATRQFDSALGTWEAAFADPSVSPLDLDVTGELRDYLILSLRVERDAGRALRGLEKLAARRDAPRYLKGKIRVWTAALGELERARSSGTDDDPDLARARRMVAQADSVGGFPHSHKRLVFDLAASGELNRLLDLQPEPQPELAEAYYLLGAIEVRSADSYWIPQAEFHLATAVSLAPDGPFAEPAYELLEEYAVANYGGTTEEWVPDSVRSRLTELQKLLERAGTDPQP